MRNKEKTPLLSLLGDKMDREYMLYIFPEVTEKRNYLTKSNHLLGAGGCHTVAAMYLSGPVTLSVK